MKKYLGGLALAAVTTVLFTVTADDNMPHNTVLTNSKLEVATFAGGCFWCTESGFEQVPGVAEAISGYTGGLKENPTYKQVSAGTTDHLESVQVYYDPTRVSYEALLESFWRQVNPTDPSGQFVDRGKQYSTAIFYHNEKQKSAAELSLKQLAATGRYSSPIVTPIIPAGKFYQAEEYHQDYYKKNPLRYKFYRYNSGRDQYLEKTWGKDLFVDLPTVSAK